MQFLHHKCSANFPLSLIPLSIKCGDPHGEDAMMATRWREFKFTHMIPKAEQIKFPPCPRCFAELATMDIEFD